MHRPAGHPALVVDPEAEAAREVGERIGNELGIPVYLYEDAATIEKAMTKKIEDTAKGLFDDLKKTFGQ